MSVGPIKRRVQFVLAFGCFAGLGVASDLQLLDTIKNQKTEVAAKLIKPGTDVNASEGDGSTGCALG
jgi:hypothetical protein